MTRASAPRGRPRSRLLPNRVTSTQSLNPDARCNPPRGGYTSPSDRDDPCCAPHRRVAFSMSVSRHGWRSKVERLITLSTSLVAVCCSSASISSRFRASEFREQADVLDGDHRLIREGLQELDLARGKRTTMPRPIAIAPIATPSRSIGTPTRLRMPSDWPMSWSRNWESVSRSGDCATVPSRWRASQACRGLGAPGAWHDALH